MRHPAVILAIVLLILSAAIISYRIISLDYPIFPSPKEKAWRLSMEAQVKPYQKEITIRIGLPSSQSDKVEEEIPSGSLNFNLLHEGPNRIGICPGSIDGKGEIIGYSGILILNHNPPPQKLSSLPEPYLTTVGVEEKLLAKRLVEKWKQLPAWARLHAISGTASDAWGEPPPDSRDLHAWVKFREKHNQLTALLVLLHAACLPARTVYGLLLTKGVTNVPIRWIEVWTGKQWNRVQPETGMVYDESVKFLTVSTGGLHRYMYLVENALKSAGS